MAGMPRNGKKGISLAYVIVAAMVLLILSGVLASAAMRNMSLTAASTGERQAYLTVKSAVEYAKGEAYRKEKAGGLADFSVAPGGDPFRTVAAADPDGKEIYAWCTVKDGLVTVSGRVAYGDSGRYRSLGCSFRLTEEEEESVFPMTDFPFVGGRYRNGELLNNGVNLNNGTLDYPLFSQKSVVCQSTINGLSIPSIYFMGGFSVQNSGSGATLHTDFLYINGNIDSNSQNTRINLASLSKDQKPVIWFHNTTVSVPGKSLKIDDGPYQPLNSVSNVLDIDAFPSQFKKISDEEYDKLEPCPGRDELSYLQANYQRIYSGENSTFGGVSWSVDRKLSIHPSDQSGNCVFMYTDKNSYNADLQNTSNPITYRADTIMWQHVSNSSIMVPASLTFQANVLWLNEQSQDGPVNNSDGVFAIQQKNYSGKFILKTPSGSDPVLVYLPHGLAVKNAAGAELYSVSAGTYSVESGTDLFQADESAFASRPSGGGGSGGGSGEGGVTVSGLKYTDS